MQSRDRVEEEDNGIVEEEHDDGADSESAVIDKTGTVVEDIAI